MNIDFLCDFNISNQSDKEIYLDSDCPVFRVSAKEMRKTDKNNFFNFILMVSRALGTIIFHNPTEEELNATYIAVKSWLPKGVSSFYFTRACFGEVVWLEVITDVGNHICTSVVKGEPNIVDGEVVSVDMEQVIPFVDYGGEQEC